MYPVMIFQLLFQRLGKVRVVGVTCASCSSLSLKGMKFPVSINYIDEGRYLVQLFDRVYIYLKNHSNLICTKK